MSRSTSRVSDVLEVAGVAAATVGVLILFGVGWALLVAGVVSTVFGFAMGGK